MNQKVFSSALSVETKVEAALENVGAKICGDLGPKSCDLALVFIAESYPGFVPKSAFRHFQDLVKPRIVLGCNANGVVGDRTEIEMQPAVSALAMHLPGVKITPFALTPREIETMKNGSELVQELDIYPTEKPFFIVLADPASCDVNKVLGLFNEGYSRHAVVGGLASGMVVGRDTWLALNDEIYSSGAVGLALSGNIEFETIVSQGCRPIGEPFTVTKAEDNLLYELAGKSPLETFRGIYEKLSTRDQQLAQNSLFVGLAMDELKTAYKRGDFLIRNIVGADRNTGAIAIGEMLQVGQTLQFQLRDAETSTEDLQILLKQNPGPGSSSQGGILVTCCGRGKGLFGEPNHDVSLIQKMRGPVPLTGFFANGEFGPIDQKNYVHGYTSSLTLIR